MAFGLKPRSVAKSLMDVAAFRSANLGMFF
jgi:hypothetical protein